MDNQIFSKEILEKARELIELSDGYLKTFDNLFMDEYFIFEDKYNVLYIYCEKYSDARICQELWNSDLDFSRKYFAEFPTHKEFSNLTGYFIHLLPKFHNTNN